MREATCQARVGDGRRRRGRAGAAASLGFVLRGLNRCRLRGGWRYFSHFLAQTAWKRPARFWPPIRLLPREGTRAPFQSAEGRLESAWRAARRSEAGAAAVRRRRREVFRGPGSSGSRWGPFPQPSAAAGGIGHAAAARLQNAGVGHGGGAFVTPPGGGLKMAASRKCGAERNARQRGKRRPSGNAARPAPPGSGLLPRSPAAPPPARRVM